MYNMSRGQSRGAFLHVKYGHTWKNTHVHTHTTHITHIGALGKMPTNRQPPLFKMGTPRPREEPPHTLRLKTPELGPESLRTPQAGLTK